MGRFISKNSMRRFLLIFSQSEAPSHLKRVDDELVVFAVDVEHDFDELRGNIFRLEDGLEILLTDVFDVVLHFRDQSVKT